MIDLMYNIIGESRRQERKLYPLKRWLFSHTRPLNEGFFWSDENGQKVH